MRFLDFIAIDAENKKKSVFPKGSV